MDKLRDLRVLKRMTQFQLRLLTGIHQSKISLVENGLMQPTEEELKKFAKALGVKEVDLLQGADMN